MRSVNKSYRLYITNESIPRIINVQATNTPGLFENRTAYFQGERQGRKWVGSWLRWKIQAEKLIRKSKAKPTELVKKVGRQQKNFWIDKANADRLPDGEPRHRLINQLLAAHFNKSETAGKLVK